MERNMGYKNEAEIMRALGIESWRNLSKKKAMRFAAMMPDMDTEVALKIIEQFPAFKDFALAAVDAVKKAHESTLSANEHSQDHVYRALQEIRDILKGELDKDGLSWDEKKFIIEQIQETGRLAFQKDRENKEFLAMALKTVAITVGAAATLAVAFAGGRVSAGYRDNPEDSLEA